MRYIEIKTDKKDSIGHLIRSKCDTKNGKPLTVYEEIINALYDEYIILKESSKHAELEDEFRTAAEEIIKSEGDCEKMSCGNCCRLLWTDHTSKVRNLCNLSNEKRVEFAYNYLNIGKKQKFVDWEEVFEKERGCTINEVGYEKYIEWLKAKLTSAKVTRDDSMHNFVLEREDYDNENSLPRLCPFKKSTGKFNSGYLENFTNCIKGSCSAWNGYVCVLCSEKK